MQSHIFVKNWLGQSSSLSVTNKIKERRRYDESDVILGKGMNQAYMQQLQAYPRNGKQKKMNKIIRFQKKKTCRCLILREYAII